MPVRHIFWESEAVSSHCLATCSSSFLFSPVTSITYMGPALEEFRLGFKCSSPTCGIACYFLGHGNMCERGSVIANFTAVGATFNSCWDQLVASVPGNSLWLADDPHVLSPILHRIPCPCHGNFLVPGECNMNTCSILCFLCDNATDMHGKKLCQPWKSSCI